MSYTMVFFDLETTGLDTQACDIIQVSAVCGQRVFNAYTIPRCDITEAASKITGFAMVDGALFHRGHVMPTVPLGNALASLIHFLRSFCGPVYLAAHNTDRFDTPVLIRVLREFSLLEEFQRVVSGFVDTLLLSKKLFPDIDSYSLKNLVHFFLKRNFDAHNAQEDAIMLQDLFNKWQPDRNAVWCSMI